MGGSMGASTCTRPTHWRVESCTLPADLGLHDSLHNSKGYSPSGKKFLTEIKHIILTVFIKYPYKQHTFNDAVMLQ